MAAEGSTEPAELLVELLSESRAPGPIHRHIEDALVARGEAVIPALESELHLGLRGHEAQAYTDHGRPRRGAVVRVLARIPGDRSTELLVRALADHPDNFAMRIATLRAVEARALTPLQIAALLRNPEPAPALLGLKKAGYVGDDPVLRPLVARLFDPATSKEQFRNEYGASNANADHLWEVRLAAGKALGLEMLPEIQQRARDLIDEIPFILARWRESDAGAFMYDWSEGELALLRVSGALVALGEPARRVARDAARTASGEAASALDMALLALGERERPDSVAATLTDSANASLRVCSALALRRAKHPGAKPALWKALSDPFRRRTGVCVGDREVYPVRQAAADALIEAGEDPKVVRARAAEGRVEKR